MRADLLKYSRTLHRPIVASGQRHERRNDLVLRLEHDGVVGWGTVSPQPETVNGDPSIVQVEHELTTVALPRLMDIVARESSVPTWSRIGALSSGRPASAVAMTLIEMAVLDLTLRSEQQTIALMWPSLFNGVSIWTVDTATHAWAPPADVSLVRLKVNGAPIPTATLSQLEATNLPVLLDYNCAQPTIAEVQRDVTTLATVATVRAVEQPFAAGNVVDHALLANQIDVPVSLDEGVQSRRDIENIVRYKAASLVCLKPARIGGYQEFITARRFAADLGLDVYLGGFFENPLARTLHRRLAHHFISLPCDIGNVTVVEGDEPVWESSAYGIGRSPSRELEDCMVSVACVAQRA
jgi:O-succinylbenzoate synthase